MKLKFTRKTWYFFLLAAAAVSMLGGFAVLGGMDFSALELVAFCLTGIAALFLAAQKGAPAAEKRNYTLVFVLLMLSKLAAGGWAGDLCSALVWPALLGIEYSRGKPIQRQLQLVCAAEVLRTVFWLLTRYAGMAGLAFWTNLLFVLLACAMLAGLLMTTAFARASDYLMGYGVWATAKSDGVVRIHADVEAVRTSDEVGVSYITVQESDDGGKTWTTLKKYTKEDLNMYEENTDYYYGTFDFEDTVIGRDYRALVGVYAERNGGCLLYTSPSPRDS